MENTLISSLRKKVSNYRGLRKVNAQVDLIRNLVKHDSAEALELSEATLKSARSLLADAAARNAVLEPYREVLAKALQMHAYALKVVLRYGESLVALEESMQLFEELRNVEGLIRSHQLLHNLYRDQTKIQEALEVLDRAITIAEIHKYEQENAALQGERGTVLAMLGRKAEANAAFEMGLEIAARNNNFMVLIILLGNFGSYQQRSGNLDKAAALFRKALDIDAKQKALGPFDHVALIWNLVHLARLKGKMEELLGILDEGITVTTAANLEVEHAQFKFFKAQMLIIQGNYLQAHDHVQQVTELEVFKSVDMVAAKYWALKAHIFALVRDTASSAAARQEAVQYLHKLEVNSIRLRLEIISIVSTILSAAESAFDLAAFETLYRKSVADYSTSINSATISGMQFGLGRLLEKTGKRREALELYMEVEKVSRARNWPQILVGVLLAIGRLDDVTGDRLFAIRCLEEALLIAEMMGARNWRLKVHDELVRLHVAQGDAHEALKHLQAVQSLEQELLAPQKVMPIWLQQLEAEKLVLSRKIKDKNSEIAELQKARDSRQRVLQTRETLIAHLGDLFNSMHEQLARHTNESAAEFMQRISELRRGLPGLEEQATWREFEEEVSDSDEDFLKRLSQKYPRLTATERKICSLIRLDNTSKDLTRLLNIAPRSLQSHRYRIRKKMGLDSGTDLNAFIMQL